MTTAVVAVTDLPPSELVPPASRRSPTCKSCSLNRRRLFQVGLPRSHAKQAGGRLKPTVTSEPESVVSVTVLPEIDLMVPTVLTFEADGAAC